MNHFFVISLAVFWVAAFASASNDVASDGFYLLALEKDQQSFFLGIRSTFYRLSMLTGNGLIVIIGGYLEQEYGDKQKAWSYTMIIVGLLMTLITIYNYFATPRTEKAIVKNSVEAQNASFGTVFASFFQKKQIGIVLAFILLFRLGESQLLKMLTPFLIDDITCRRSRTNHTRCRNYLRNIWSTFLNHWWNPRWNCNLKRWIWVNGCYR